MVANESGNLLTGLPPIPEHEFCVYGTVYAYPEHANALQKVYEETTRLAQSEPGTIYYSISRDEDDPTVFYFYERYSGKKAFDAHNDQPIIRKLIEDKLFKGVDAKFGKALGPFVKSGQ